MWQMDGRAVDEYQHAWFVDDMHAHVRGCMPVSMSSASPEPQRSHKHTQGSHVLVLRPEIQGIPETMLCRLLYFSPGAQEHVKGPVMCEDTSLCYHALKGLPGAKSRAFYMEAQR